MKLIELKDIYFSYKSTQIFQNLNITFDNNKVYSIIGHNGAGKTTLLRLIVGLLKPKQGQIVCKNVTFNYLPDAGGLYEDLTVKQNIEIFHELQLGEKINSELIKNLKEWGLIDKRNSTVRNLSMGQKRRLALMISTFSNYDVLLLDEPTNGIDISSQNTLNKYLIQQKEKGKTLIISSHDLKLVEKISDVIMIVEKGKVVFQGNINELDNIDDLYLSYTDQGENNNV